MDRRLQMPPSAGARSRRARASRAGIDAADECADERVELLGLLQIGEVARTFDLIVAGARDEAGELVRKCRRCDVVLRAAKDQSRRSDLVNPLALVGEP